jgi:ubiquitin carboxyl-terminal hydrolase 7
MSKINDYFEFYEELELSKYLSTNNTNNNSIIDSESNKFTLHSVVVHQGNANSGHYYAYIRPALNDNWIQFNDEIVKPADKYEVFDNNYGGSLKTYKYKGRGEITETITNLESNAYILVYIKNSERKNIISPLSISEVKYLF